MPLAFTPPLLGKRALPWSTTLFVAEQAEDDDVCRYDLAADQRGAPEESVQDIAGLTKYCVTRTDELANERCPSERVQDVARLADEAMGEVVR